MAYESSPAPEERPARKGAKLPVSTYLDEELYDRLVEVARENDRALAAEIRAALRRHVTEASA